MAAVRLAWVQQQQQQEAVAAEGTPARVRSGRAVGPRDPARTLCNVTLWEGPTVFDPTLSLPRDPTHMS